MRRKKLQNRPLILTVVCACLIFFVAVEIEAQWASGVFKPEMPRFTFVYGYWGDNVTGSTVGGHFGYNVAKNFQVVGGAEFTSVTWNAPLRPLIVFNNGAEFISTTWALNLDGFDFSVIGLGMRYIIPIVQMNIKAFVFGDTARGFSEFTYERIPIENLDWRYVAYGGGVLKQFNRKSKVWLGLAHTLQGVDFDNKYFNGFEDVRWHVGGTLNLSSRLSLSTGLTSTLEDYNPDFSLGFSVGGFNFR